MKNKKVLPAIIFFWFAIAYVLLSYSSWTTDIATFYDRSLRNFEILKNVQFQNVVSSEKLSSENATENGKESPHQNDTEVTKNLLCQNDTRVGDDFKSKNDNFSLLRKYFLNQLLTKPIPKTQMVANFKQIVQELSDNCNNQTWMKNQSESLLPAHIMVSVLNFSHLFLKIRVHWGLLSLF